MSYKSTVQALVTLFQQLPGVQTVERGDQHRLGQPGSVQPQPGQCPEIRVMRGSYRARGEERGMTLDGSFDRRTPYLVEIWNYYDPAVLTSGGADAFADLVETVQAQIRRNPRLAQLAEAPGSHVLQAAVIRAEPTPRPVSIQNGRALLRDSFTVQVREQVQ